MIPRMPAAGATLWIFLLVAAIDAQVGRGVLDPISAVVDRGRYTRLFGNRSTSGLDSSWEVWWELNKDQYLDLTNRGSRVMSESHEVFLGRRARSAPARRPFGDDDRRQQVIDALHASLDDKQEAVRAAAAYSLGMLGKFCPSHCFPRLIKALSDRSSRVKDVVIIALGLSESEIAHEPLMSIFRGGKSGARLLGLSKVTDRRRALAAIGLGLTRDTKALGPLAEAALARRENRDVRAASILALGLLGRPEAMPALDKLIAARRTQVQLRALAVTSLGRIGCDGCLRTIGDALNHRHLEVRRAAVLTLGRLRPMTPALDRLKEIEERIASADARSEVAALREEAQSLQARAADETSKARAFRVDARKWLAASATRDVYEVRTLATVALGQVGADEDMDLLVELLFGSNQEIRNFAALAIGILGRRGHDPGGFGYQALTRTLKRERRLEKIASLGIALGIYGKRDAAKLIRARIRKRSDPLLRSYLTLALGMLGDPEGQDRVVYTLLRARNADELQNAAEGLVLMRPGAETVEQLRRVLAKSRDRYERIGAGVGLAFLGDPVDLKALADFARNTKNPQDARAFVLEGLGVAGNVRDPDPLARLAAGHDFYVGIGAVDAVLSLKW